MKHKFGVGMKVVVTGIKNENYMKHEGTVAEVTGGFGNHTWKTGDQSGTSPNTYQVTFRDGSGLNVAPSCLTLARPVSRGDLDTKVSWKELEATTGYKRRPEDLV